MRELSCMLENLVCYLYVVRVASVQQVYDLAQLCRSASFLQYIYIAKVLQTDVLREDVDVGGSKLSCS